MWGTITTDGAAKVLTFERLIARPPEKVWAALITPERIGDWMCADAEVEPRAGGRFHLAFRNFNHRMEGTITRYEPPHVLEYTWPENAANGESLVLWELTPTPAGTRLVLTHTLPKGGDLPGFASGWHWHLDALPAAVDEHATPWHEPTWRALQERYLTHVG
jgi:uncharacterized protein YndB with AHSA1/START domain